MLREFHLAFRDLASSVRQWRFWCALAVGDIAKQYRQTFLGPWWITVSNGFFIALFAVIGAEIFSWTLRDYLPYFAVGVVFFWFWSSVISDACDVFTSATPFIKHSSIEKNIFIFRALTRNLIALAHNLPILVIVLFTSDLLGVVNWAALAVGVVVGLPILFFGVGVIAVVSTRFRDVGQIVRTVMNTMFFVTPVMWNVDSLSAANRWLVDFNPFARLLELIRTAIAGGALAASPLWFLFWVTVVAAILYAICFVVARRRLAYWV